MTMRITQRFAPAKAGFFVFEQLNQGGTVLRPDVCRDYTAASRSLKDGFQAQKGPC